MNPCLVRRVRVVSEPHELLARAKRGDEVEAEELALATAAVREELQALRREVARNRRLLDLFGVPAGAGVGELAPASLRLARVR